MKTTHNRRTFLGLGLVGVLSLSLFTGCTTKNEDSSQARSKLGTIPEFHPELGLGALQGYLDPKDLPDSLALIPPPPLAGSAALAHDEEVARSSFALRDTPRFALAASDFDLKVPNLVNDFSCALGAPITKEELRTCITCWRDRSVISPCQPTPRRTITSGKRPFQENNEPIAVPRCARLLREGPLLSVRAYRRRLGIRPHPERD